MFLRAVHIISILLIVLLGGYERSMCESDHCDDHTTIPVAAVVCAEHHHHGDHAPVDGVHHCDQCACLCHMAALVESHGEQIVLPQPSLRGSPLVYFPPSAPVDPLDHVPLV